LMIALAYNSTAKTTMRILAIFMAVSVFIWFSTLTNAIILITFAFALYFLSIFRSASSFILCFLGVASVIYIIQDFNVGPTSDLQAYESEVGLFSAGTWMYIWLGLVITITAINLKFLLTTWKR
jgi:hypothetical protein